MDRTSAADDDLHADRHADGPTEVPPRGWWQVAKKSWSEAGEENLGLIASGVAFYAFLAFVPLLTAVVLSYGLIADPGQVARHIAGLTATLPEDAASIIGDQLRNIVESADSTAGFGLLIALAIALYGAMKGAGAIVTALNIVYDIDESRSFVKQTLVSLAITFCLVLIFLFASIAISALNALESLLPGLGGAIHLLLKIAFWIAAGLGVSLVIAAIYRYAPNRPDAQWAWITPGSALATIVWILATLGFAFYVRNFGSYNATYGSLGAVIVFLTWLYLSAYILLIGAEVNQVLERRVGADKTLGGAREAAEAEAKSGDRKPVATGEASPAPHSAAGPETERRRDPSAAATPSFGAVLAKWGGLAMLLGLLGGSSKRERGSAA